MDDLHKLKKSSLVTLAKLLQLNNLSKLSKKDLIELINQKNMIVNQTGGDTCIYPCPDQPDGHHEWENAGYGWRESNEHVLWKCRHCQCKIWSN